MKLKNQFQLFNAKVFHKLRNASLYTFLIFLIISALLYSMIAQGEHMQGILAQFNYQDKDTLKNQPKIDIKVNRKYDEHGNLIQFDSTYSYVYSSEGNRFTFEMDTLMERNFQKFFNRSFPKDPFMNPFFDDSSMFGSQNLFSTDPFTMHLKMLEEIKQFMQQMPQNRVLIPAPPQSKAPQKAKPKVEKQQPKVEPEKEESNYITM